MSQIPDFDDLKIPAFLRKRSLAVRDKKKLLLTALDRQKAGLLEDKISRKKKNDFATALDRQKAGLLAKKKVKKTGISLDLHDLNFKRPPKIKIDTTQKASSDVFSLNKVYVRQKDDGSETIFTPNIKKQVEPVFAEEIPYTRKLQQEFEELGVITHYFEKIKVGVIKLKSTLVRGDEVVYSGTRQQINSMQINRKDVDVAYAGHDIGVKLDSAPKIGDKVYKIIENF